MNILESLFGSFESTVESLRQYSIFLEKSRESVVLRTQQHLKTQKKYAQNKDYFQKSTFGKSILESNEQKFQLSKTHFFEFCEKEKQKQERLKKSISKVYKKSPDLSILSEFQDFIPEQKFNSILVNLTKAHRDGSLPSSKLLELRKYRRVDLLKGSAYVKDNRTHFSDVIVINELNEILFLKRNKLDDFEPGVYGLPGGHVDPGEDFQYAAIRELSEETGIKVDESSEIEHVGDYIDNKIAIHYFSIKVQKDLTLPFLEERESSQWEWIPITELNHYRLIKNLKENFKKVIDIPVKFLNPEIEPNLYVAYVTGELVKSEEQLELQKSLETSYRDMKTGLMDPSVFENLVLEGKASVETFSLYKSTGEVIYGLKLCKSTEDNSKGDTQEKLIGGKADSKSVEDIAFHHNCSIGDIEDELHIGEKVEMEHTDDKKEAIEIAKDHLWEISDYYTRLAKMEKEAKKEESESDTLEKAYSHKYLRREGSPGSYKYYYQDDEGNESWYLGDISIIDHIISKLEKPIEEITKLIEKDTFEQTGRDVSEYDKEMIRLSLLSDMTTSLSKYLKVGDELQDFSIRLSRKGTFKVDLVILRDDIPHRIVTDAIYAGGYNIQRLHYRYITTTDLPQNTPSITNKYEEKMKKMKKSEKIKSDLEGEKKHLESRKVSLEERKSFTDEQILAESSWSRFKDLTWQDMIDRGNTANFNNSEEEFHASQEKYRRSIIDGFKRMTALDEEQVKSIEKNIVKLSQKLEETLEKGKSAQIGEIREWSGVKMKKTADGWKPVREEKEKKSEDEKKETSTQKEDLPEEKPLNDEELEKFARETSTADLKAAADGKDEVLRIASKKELERRETEHQTDEATDEKTDEVSTEITRKALEEKADFLKKEFLKTKEYGKAAQIARYIRRINDFLEVDTKTQVEKFQETLGMTSSEVKALFGDGAILGFNYRGDVFFQKGKGVVDINILTKDMCCSRMLNFNKKKVTNEEFLLDVDLEKGKGKGTEIFVNQVEQFRKLGFKTMETTACRNDDSQNGYYSWARLGYDIPKDTSSYTQFQKLVESSSNEEIKGCETLSQLMSLKEGREFWKKEGFTFLGVFDLNENSDSMKILKAYQSSKKK